MKKKYFSPEFDIYKLQISNSLLDLSTVHEEEELGEVVDPDIEDGDD